jgi:hypothetical protein
MAGVVMSASTMSLSRRRNALFRHHGAGADVVLEAERDLRFAQLQEKISAAVEAAPPLTDDQVISLRALLGPSR